MTYNYGGNPINSKKEALSRIAIGTVIAILIVVYAFTQTDDGVTQGVFSILALATWAWIVSANLIPVMSKATLGTFDDLSHNIGIAMGK